MKKKILAIDYGLKRCGMALSDELHISMRELPTLETKELEQSIIDLISAEPIGILLFGESRHADNTRTRHMKSIDNLIVRLKKKIDPEVEFKFVDESFTSEEAKELMILSGVKKKDRRNKEMLDMISAKLILKRYLDTIYG